MENNLLLTKVQLLQDNYLMLLKSVLPSLTESNYLYALDEIHLFWVEQEKLVELFLDYEFLNSDSFFFTGATDIDYDSGDHFPLMVLGKYHVFDDPLCRYSEFCITYDDLGMQKKLYEMSIKCVENNIKILENCKGKIIILPVRVNNRTKAGNYFFESSEMFFINYFKEIRTVDEYSIKCQTIDDVLLELHDNIQGYIRFFDFEDSSLSLKKRFLLARKKLKSYLGDMELNDAMLFLKSQIGMYFQAVDLLTTCLLYNAYPLLRSQVVEMNFFHLCEIIDDENLKLNLRIKSYIGYLVYLKLNKMEVASIGIEKFYNYVAESKFYESVCNEVEKQSFTSSTVSLSKIKGIILEKLDMLFSHFDVSNE